MIIIEGYIQIKKNYKSIPDTLDFLNFDNKKLGIENLRKLKIIASQNRVNK